MASPPKYQPIRLVSPALKRALSRKFILPDDPREQSLGIIIVALACVIGAGWSPMAEVVASVGAERADARLAQAIPYRGKIEQRLVGLYVYRDADGRARMTRSTRVRLKPEAFPVTATVVHPRGQPEKARTVGEYRDRWPVLGGGLALLGFGLWWRMRPRAAR
jgi:hypothetical protein